MAKNPEPPPIHVVRRQRVVLDHDLAKLYGVTTKAFNQAIQRNRRRFPHDFLFQVSPEEVANLRSQIVTSSLKPVPGPRSQSVTLNAHGGRRYQPLAFTEHGAIMAATVLRSPRAVAMSVYVVRAFVRMRDELMTNLVILKRLEQIDRKLLEHDVVLRDLVEKLMPLLTPPPEAPRKEMGFHTTLRKP
jgi:hypothetical protein